MDGFINFLEEYKTDERIVTGFKEKINKPVEYITHLDEFKFDKKWFEQLDIILTQLGYRCLDEDIRYIHSWLIDKLKTIHINKIDPDYNVEKLLTDDGYLSHDNNLEILTYLIEHPDKINWYWFSGNKSDMAVKYSLEYLNKINWRTFSENESENAVYYLLEHPDKIEWEWFSINASDIAVRYLLEYPDKINWYWFSGNKSDIAVQYLLENPDKINWEWFSRNESDIAVRYLLEHPDKIKWCQFSNNRSDIAVKYLLEHPDKINWEWFSVNKNINTVKYCIENNKHTIYENLLIVEKISADKIIAFNKLNWLQMSKMQL